MNAHEFSDRQLRWLEIIDETGSVVAPSGWLYWLENTEGRHALGTLICDGHLLFQKSRWVVSDEAKRAIGLNPSPLANITIDDMRDRLEAAIVAYVDGEDVANHTGAPYLQDSGFKDHLLMDGNFNLRAIAKLLVEGVPETETPATEDRGSSLAIPLTLGDLAERMSGLLKSTLVFVELEDGKLVHPGRIRSYRGYYEQLAFSEGTEPTDVLELRSTVSAILGETIRGYKGGSYVADQNTQLWFSEYGEASGIMIVAADVVDGALLLRTRTTDSSGDE